MLNVFSIESSENDDCWFVRIKGNDFLNVGDILKIKDDIILLVIESKIKLNEEGEPENEYIAKSNVNKDVHSRKVIGKLAYSIIKKVQ